MKLSFLSALMLVLLAAAPAFAGNNPIGGVYYKCINDPDQEKRFLGISGGPLEDEARRAANKACDDAMGGDARDIVYIYSDGSTQSAN